MRIPTTTRSTQPCTPKTSGTSNTLSRVRALRNTTPSLHVHEWLARERLALACNLHACMYGVHGALPCLLLLTPLPYARESGRYRSNRADQSHNFNNLIKAKKTLLYVVRIIYSNCTIVLR